MKDFQKEGIKRLKPKSSGILFKKWNKAGKSIFSGFAVQSFVCICIAGCSQNQPLEKLSLSAGSEQIYDINHQVDIVLETTPEDCDIPKSAFEVSGSELDIKNDKITFTSSADGEFDIYVEYSDITSNTITLKFEDKEAAAQAEQERIAAEQAEQARIAQEQSQQTAPIEEMVWLSATGTKYHNKPNCGNMNASRARQVPLSEASQNYEACKNCYR